MSSSQDVRYSDAKVAQGRDLTNKLWNASRLDPPERGRRRARALRQGGRGPLDRLAARAHGRRGRPRASRPTTSPAPSLELYRFFWSEFCDWYLEIVKPRLYDGEPEVAGHLVWVLQRFLALAHPFIPFVTEEIWSYVPAGRGRPADRLGVSRGRRVADRRRGRGRDRGRDRADAPGQALARPRGRARCERPARARRRAGSSDPHELVGRLARLELNGAGGDALASVGTLELLGSDEIDPAQVAERIEARAAELRAEVERGERKLSNEGFVAKAPPEVVEEERAKLEGYRAELAELE